MHFESLIVYNFQTHLPNCMNLSISLTYFNIDVSAHRYIWYFEQHHLLRYDVHMNHTTLHVQHLYSPLSMSPYTVPSYILSR